MARRLVPLVVLALLLCAVDAKKPKNTTEIHVDDPMSGALNPGETLLYWYNARTDSTALFFRLKYPPLPELDADIQMIARFSTDLWQPPVTTANCSVGECYIELRGPLNITYFDDGKLKWSEFSDPGFPWVIEVGMSNATFLNSTIFSLYVEHNYTKEGISKGKTPVIIVSSVLGGISVIVAVYAEEKTAIQ